MTAYEVTVTIREHFTITVEAASAAEARKLFREGHSDGEWTSCSDRVVTGIRVTRADA